MGANSRQSSFSRSFMPFEYERFGLTLQVNNYELDGAQKEDLIEPQRQIVDLSRQKEWNDLKLNIEVTVPKNTLESVLPDSDYSNMPVWLIVVWECNSTFWREFKRVPIEPGKKDYFTSVNLPYDDVRDKIVLKPYIVRSETNDEEPEGFAHKKGTKLASSREWVISVAKNDEPIGGYLDIQYKSFEDWDRNEINSNQIYHLDVNAGPEPTLWLNGDHSSIKEIMDSTGTSGKPPRIRDVTFDIILHGTWTKLFLDAAAAVDENGDTLYNWQQAVLQRLVPIMYPETSMETAISDIRQNIQEGENPSQVVGRLNSAIQTSIDNRDIQDHLTKLIEEVIS